MAYVKQTWQCGDVVTADKLNHIEDGIANNGSNGFTIATLTYDHSDSNDDWYSCDVSADDIADILDNSGNVIFKLTPFEGYGTLDQYTEPFQVVMLHLHVQNIMSGSIPIFIFTYDSTEGMWSLDNTRYLSVDS